MKRKYEKATLTIDGHEVEFTNVEFDCGRTPLYKRFTSMVLLFYRNFRKKA
jgi:hypothetical protein